MSSRRSSREKRVRSLVLDRTFPTVGRLTLASGTNKRPVFVALNGMLTALATGGRLDLLVALRDHAIHPLALWDKFRRGRLDELLRATEMVPFAAAFAKWREGGNVRKGRAWSRWYAQAIRYTEKRLLSHARPGAKVGDVPVLLLAHRLDYANRQKTFDNDRVAVMGFLRDTCGRSSAVYRAVTEIEAYHPARQIIPRQQSPAALTDWAKKLDVETAKCCWAMATTGMGPGEYWGAWERQLDRIWIAGSAKAGDGKRRERVVPDLGWCRQRPSIGRQAFEDRLAEQTESAFRPYDLRRTYAQWMEFAGLPFSRRQMYFGHSLKTVMGLYTQHEVTEHLRADAKILRNWIRLHSRDITRDRLGKRD